ncbi:MAG: UvrD-helicase domain-containing protein [Brevundimonas sp.]|uniref:UvrD-helicase domain-containing protein n=1 Tax=Brevundimonas sp. TaxID=1871086 RepID=UPI002736F27D|nr:UvrD-helicase domain-containing protein [Brevundimonas sp.]MDP3404934.1 UvrD-helicase domain-containing protein [Brevundimonas sp.]
MFIAIRRDAAEEIIAGRVLQSNDFPEGQNLARQLRAGSLESVGPRISTVKSKHGVIAYGRDAAEHRYIVFDLEQSRIFAEITNDQAILYLQRVLRFAIKFWDKGVLTHAEKVLSATTAALFPYPISQKTRVRIALDLNPDLERLAKRDKSGRYLLVYKISTDQGDGPQETASVATFRKFLEDLDGLGAKLEAVPEDSPPAWETNFTGTSLGPLASKVDIHQGYETWLRLLTESQKKFIFSPLLHPVRIDGPAGTGKTASLALAAIHSMQSAASENRELQAIFITHSEASRRSISTVLEAMGGGDFVVDQSSIRRLRVETLQGYCSGLLRQEISETEFVDTDAYDAKQLQLMYVDEALRQVRSEYESYAKFMSPDFKSYMDGEEDEFKIPLIQHEISVVIKGRAKENLDTYKKIPPIPSALPVTTEGDKAFVWRVYERYREQLVAGGQFDTDDVVLSALSQLSTPIWRRRRARDGFDAIFVDETHLFNMNELSIFHHLTRSEKSFPIAFAVDRSQAIGDRGWADDIDVASLMPSQEERSSSTVINVKGIFRCSPDIVNLAFSITSSGASLFTNFQDPMALAHSNMTFMEERKAKRPYYIEYPTDEAMVDAALLVAEEMRVSVGSSKGDVAIVVFDESLFHELERRSIDENRPVEILKHRGDPDVVRRAKSAGRFVLSLPDYVGGLEFDGVVLVGVDDGRVPPSPNGQHSQSRAYLTFAAHNKLYVAVTRARYQVAILGVQARGPSVILKSALDAGALERSGA